jgi:dihydrofolate reductase
MRISFVLAVSENYGIGIDNKLPWAHLKRDMAWFKQNTKGKPVVMGSSTWDSLPLKPLPGRTNVVLTTRGAIVGSDLVLSGAPNKVVANLAELFPSQEVCVIGGAKVYEELWPYVYRIYLTRVPQVVEADTYLRIDDLMQSDTTNEYQGWRLTSRETHFDPDHVTFEIWDYK